MSDFIIDCLKESIRLIEMAMDKKNAEDKFISHSEELNKHLAYIYMMGLDFPATHHWIQEVSTILEELDNIKIKTKKGKLKDSFVSEIFWELEEPSDARVYIGSVWESHFSADDHGEYGVPHNYELDWSGDNMWDFIYFMDELKNKCVRMINEKHDNSKEQYQRVIEMLLRKVGK